MYSPRSASALAVSARDILLTPYQADGVVKAAAAAVDQRMLRVLPGLFSIDQDDAHHLDDGLHQTDHVINSIPSAFARASSVSVSPAAATGRSGGAGDARPSHGHGDARRQRGGSIDDAGYVPTALRTSPYLQKLAS